MSQYAHLSIVDPEFAKAAANVPPPEPTDDIQLRRERFNGLIKMLNERDKALLPPESELRVEEHKVPVDGGQITVRCMIPTPTGGSPGTFPFLVNYHGGGYFVGGLEVDTISLQQACVEQQVSVMDVDYRLSPEFPWPIPHNDSYAALKWAAENTTLLSADLSKGFVVRGTSSGGNLAASMALHTRDDPFFQGRPLTGQILQIPAVVSPHNIPEK
ncbi:hypothetical protein EWM64_g3203 [Hericium alpestre]|uniref:Alpha/beta hydrolase fold-3 domain-containing protein n=1 Tax=Hericium alpestre TaxID=135208 RepID=A0A4Z0A4I8_9AGAM|nr:hypothetical protein EWM64_g3203 [Hericium alpestre]